ncbi:hypothetical protein [Yeosuana sp.]|uniref:hypothetical protein n=1 Tax=Yeosuana sp. TaxID=2529388 RepID=UPI00405501E4|tara:strand:+ start:1606 stop:1938 length:333 start_codon:yes stop_codon:yes gene_type:complete
MVFKKHRVFFNIIVYTLVFALLLPSAVKFTHIFNHSKHEICLGKTTTHLHKLDLDCKFYNFKITPNFVITLFNFTIFTSDKRQIVVASQYNFLSNNQKLHFSLRAPPSLI